MAKSELIQAQVTEFFKQYPIGATSEDAFTPWYLSKVFSLSGIDANARCAETTERNVVTGFHLEEGRAPVLHIFAGIFSNDRNAIKKAILSFEKPIQILSALLKGNTPEVNDKNAIWNRLAIVLESNPKIARNLKVQFAILHLCEDANEVLWNTFAAAKERFDAWCRSSLRTHHVMLELIGPDAINPNFRAGHIPPEEQTLEFDGVELNTEGDVQYFVGIGKLADLVRLYEQYGDHLFSKNVRAFLYRALEKGPAKYMRDTLRQICDKSQPKSQRVPATNFAIFHNGVTLYTLSAQVGKDKVAIREPSILNGCQTVKNAYLFKHSFLEEKGDEKAWESIPVPLRIIVTPDVELIREVTVSNNRQNAIRPSAFRANDPVQLEISERLRAMKIWYERQEGSFENLRKSDPKRLQREYANSTEAPLGMEELCQTIACASNQPALSVASKISQLFEDAQYKRIFSMTHLKDLELLVFLRNVLKATPLIMKDIKEESGRFAEMTSTSFKFPVFRALARYAKKNHPEIVSEYGHAIINRLHATHPLRMELKKMMSHHHSGIQQLLPEIWWDEKDRIWKLPTDKDCVDSLLSKLRLADFDVFG